MALLAQTDTLLLNSHPWHTVLVLHFPSLPDNRTLKVKRSAKSRLLSCVTSAKVHHVQIVSKATPMRVLKSLSQEMACGRTAQRSAPVVAVMLLIVLHVGEDAHGAGPVAALHLLVLPDRLHGAPQP